MLCFCTSITSCILLVAILIAVLVTDVGIYCQNVIAQFQRIYHTVNNRMLLSNIRKQLYYCFKIDNNQLFSNRLLRYKFLHKFAISPEILTCITQSSIIADDN